MRFEPWATEFRTTGMGLGEINVLRILYVDGTRAGHDQPRQ